MYIGIELGSTRIKAVAMDERHKIISQGDYTWQSALENGIWTYDLAEAWHGVNVALEKLLANTNQKVAAVGVSAMMHGYLAFDRNWNLLVPFRTWQNTITGEAADILTKEFNFNIPQRWSIAHLYQAVLNNEPHVKDIAHITTLAGYVHYMLTGVNAVGVGEASGIFPIDSDVLNYNQEMVAKFNNIIARKHLPWQLQDVLPQVMTAGQIAGTLTETGAVKINNMLPVGTRFAPPEGDAGTGMTATNAVRERTGNVSAGTSIFSMVVLEKPLVNVYEEIDLVTTPAGKPVAMVHCNNCTTDFNSWVAMFKEAANLFGAEPTTDELYTKLMQHSLNGEVDCNGIVSVNYVAGEGVTHLDEGRPVVVRTPNSANTLANFLRSQLYSTMATLKIGMDILAKEHVAVDTLIGHGGLFKTEGVCQEYLAAACNAKVSVMETSGEGGPYGMAVLASYVDHNSVALEDYLANEVFANAKVKTACPNRKYVLGFNKYIKNFKKVLKAERTLLKLK